MPTLATLRYTAPYISRRNTARRTPCRYHKAVAYWDSQEASYNGVLGGYGYTSDLDVRDSRQLLLKVGREGRGLLASKTNLNASETEAAGPNGGRWKLTRRRTGRANGVHLSQ